MLKYCLLNNTYTNNWLKISRRTFETPKYFYDPFWENSVRGSQPMTKAGGWNTITIMPGIGIGPGLIDNMIEVLSCAGAPLNYEFVYPEKSEEEFKSAILSIRRNGIGIKGEIEPKEIDQLFMEPSKNAKMKKTLDLYVDVVVCKSFPGLEKQMRFHKNLDVIVMRQNSEGDYALLEHRLVKNIYENIQVISRHNSKRVFEYAFKYAVENHRNKVSLLQNYEVNPIVSHFMMDIFDQVAALYPNVKSEKTTFSNALKRFMTDNTAWDIVIMHSVKGSMLTSIMYGMIGSAALVGEVNIGDRFKLFEPANRGKCRMLDQEGIANPTGFILCGVQVLEYLGYKKPASIIRQSLEEVYQEGKVLTQDLGGNATTKEFTNIIIKKMREKAAHVLCKQVKLPPLPPKPLTIKPYDPETDIHLKPKTK